MLRHLWLSEARAIDEFRHGQLAMVVQQLNQAAAVRFANGVENEICVDHAHNQHIPAEEYK